MKRRMWQLLVVAAVLLGASRVATWAGPAFASRADLRAARSQASAPSPQPNASAASDTDATRKLLDAGAAACAAGRPAEGLVWFRQAAGLGSIEGVYRAGMLLLRGASADAPAQSVAADVPEGVRWIFRAATNRHPAACRQMATIYLAAMGVKTNLVHAYAWLRLSAALAPECLPELDALALQLDAAQLLQAQALAAQFLRGEWPPPPCKPVLPGDPRLTINGMTLAHNRPSVVINHRTLVEGETAEVPVRGGQLVLTCVEIRPDAVLVEIAGESEARLLSLR